MADTKAKDRTFSREFTILANGKLVRFHPGDTIDTSVAKDLGLGEHLFQDGDDPKAEAIDLIATTRGNHNDHTAGTAPAPTGLGSMTVVELRAYAAENGIPVGDATRKVELLNKIAQVETERAEALRKADDVEALAAEAEARQAEEAQRLADEAAAAAQKAADEAAAAAGQ